MGEKKVSNRNFVVLGAILIQLCLGAIYAWSVFTPYLAPKLPAKNKQTKEYKDYAVYVKDAKGKFALKVLHKNFHAKDATGNYILKELPKELYYKSGEDKYSLLEAKKDELYAKKVEDGKVHYGYSEKVVSKKQLYIKNGDKYEKYKLPLRPTWAGEEEKVFLAKAFCNPTEINPEKPMGFVNVDTSKLKECTVQMIVGKNHDGKKNPLAAVPSEVAAFEAKWTKSDTQIVFGVGLAFFAIIMVLAGRMMPKIGPQKLAMAGGLVLGGGYVLAGLLGGENFIYNLICIGVIGGSGIGLAYVVPIAVGMRWFPDKKGLITGLAVAGFGFGALLWVKLGGAWGQLLPTYGLNTTFIIYGAAFFLTVVIGGIWMKFPPEGWKPEGWNPPAPKKDAAPAAGSVDFKSGEMLKTPQFYMIFLTFVFGAGAGLMSIGLMKMFPTEALAQNGVIGASAIAGTAMAVFFSLANGIGRIAWGTFSELLGRKNSIILMMATQGAFVFLFQWMAGTPWMLYLGATLIGFNFGGNFSLFPTITADTFGTKYIGQNYGWVFLAYGVGGIAAPYMGGKLGDLGNFPLAFSICGVLCVVGAVVTMLIRHPKHHEA